MKNVELNVVIDIAVLGWVLLLGSCSPEYDEPNPFNYELYVNERDQYPSFSPDGEYIAYYHYSSEFPEPVDYPSGLYIIDRNGNNRQLVLDGYHESPAWSPDGEWLVFSSGGVIQRCKINGEELTRFSGLDYLENAQFFFPDWSPDMSHILFSKSFAPEGGLYYTTADFSRSGRSYDLFLETASQPELSPDGERFIFCKGSQSFEGGIELFIVDTLGTNEIRITQNSREDLGPTWSFDGQQIAWSSGVRVHTMNADGGNQKFLAYGQYPSWSVNNQIVFSHANSDYSKEVLYTIHADGSERKQITF